MTQSHFAALSWLLAAVLVAAQFQHLQAAFLSTELPLTVLLTTPAELLEKGDSSVQLSGRQAITVRCFLINFAR